MHDATGTQGGGLVDPPAGEGKRGPAGEGDGRELWFADRETRLAAARGALDGVETRYRQRAYRPAPADRTIVREAPAAPCHPTVPQPIPWGLSAGPGGLPGPGAPVRPAEAAIGEGDRLVGLEYAVVDVETTGGSGAFGHRVTEVGIVCLSGGGEYRGEFRSLVNPGRTIPPAIRRLTSISQEMVDAAPRFADVAQSVQAMLRGRVLVAHNAGFDWRFLRGEFDLCRRRVPSRVRLCTVRMSRRLVPEVRSRSLDALSRYFGIPNEARHRAWGDARATAALLVRLIERAEERAAPTLADLRTLLKPAGSKSRRRSSLPRSMEWA